MDEWFLDRQEAPNDHPLSFARADREPCFTGFDRRVARFPRTLAPGRREREAFQGGTLGVKGVPTSEEHMLSMPGSRSVGSWKSLTAAAMFVLLGSVADSAAAQNAVVVTGTVRNAVTAAPITNATVRVVGTARSSVTAADGSYRVVVGAPGSELRVVALGHAPASQQVPPSAHDAIVIDFILQPGAVLGAVVITAQREAEDAQRAPLAITVLSPEILRDAGVTRPQDLTYLTPGLQVGSLSGYSAMLYMRGVGNFSGNSLQDPTVTFNFDGVYVARQSAINGLFFDLERVEVLKGPQGTLYGRNATGGAVNILPRRPAPGVLAGEISAEYGEAGTLRAEGALNLPIGGRAAIRVAGQRARHDGYMAGGTDDQDDWAGRLSLRFDPTDALSLRMVADHYDQRGRGPGSTPLALGVVNRFGVTSPEGGAYYLGQRVTIAGRNFDPMPAIERSSNTHSGVNATMDWRSAAGALTIVSGSRWSDIDATGSPAGNFLTIQERSRQLSVESRLASVPHPRLRTLVGLFAFDESIKTPEGGHFSPHNQFNFSFQEPESGVTSLAPFARVTWNVTDRLRASLGARHTRERKHFRGSYQSFLRLCPPVPRASCPDAQPFPVDITTAPVSFPSGVNEVSVFNPADGTVTAGFRILADETARFSRTTSRAALEYDLATQSFLYASFETGFKSGGFFFSNDSQVYQPEYVEALTLGWKSRLFGSRLQANVELFDWSYRDQQVNKISVDSRGVTNLRTDNVGQATIRGVETDLEFLPAALTELSASVQYLSATYDSYAYLTPLSSGPPISGCVVTPGPAGFLVDCSGRRSPYAPQTTLSLGAAQRVLVRGGQGFVGRTRVRYQSRTLMGLDFLPEQHQDGYWMVDASLTFASAGDRHTLGVFGQNLTDQTVLSNTFVVPFSTFAVGVLRPPRTVGIRAATRF
ncbi:MAG: TonB-dependent receptor [Gemmatimonadaceae bacterium]